MYSIISLYTFVAESEKPLASPFVSFPLPNVTLLAHSLSLHARRLPLVKLEDELRCSYLYDKLLKSLHHETTKNKCLYSVERSTAGTVGSNAFRRV